MAAARGCPCIKRFSGAVMKTEFEEIGHAGGTVTVHVEEREERLSYSLEFSNSNPYGFKLISLYALPQGVPVERMTVGGLNNPFPPPKVPGSYLIHLSSDREGMFGRTCAFCNRYWRSSDGPHVGAGYCAYCGRQPVSLALTSRQRVYVQSVCALITHGIEHGPGFYRWDLNELSATPADAASQSFYLAEERQQRHRLCLACGVGQDVLGGASYCCACGTRDDRELLEDALDDARQRARSGALPGALRDAVSATDSFVAAIVSELVNRVPLTKERKAYWTGKNRPKHKFRETFERLDRDFGFKTAAALTTHEQALAMKLVARRHVHEHGGGIVDQAYLDETGDNLRLGQSITEAPKEIFEFIGLMGKFSQAVMVGFHELFPASDDAIAMGRQYGRAQKAQQARTNSKAAAAPTDAAAEVAG